MLDYTYHMKSKFCLSKYFKLKKRVATKKTFNRKMSVSSQTQNTIITIIYISKIVLNQGLKN